VYYYQSIKDDTQVIDALNALVEKHPTEGFWQLYDRLRKKGHEWNHKKVYRVYKLLGMNQKRKHKRRLLARIKEPLDRPAQINITWSLDFMSDTLVSGRRFRILTGIDDYNREALIVEPAVSLPAERVIRILDQAILYRGRPRQIRVDNGPEFLSLIFVQWCHSNDIQIKYIQPGRPMQNGFIERFNGIYRRDILNAYLFEDLNQVRMLTEKWIEDYNHYRGHDSLDKLSPVEYLLKNVNSGKL
jgi:putative transposase